MTPAPDLATLVGPHLERAGGYAYGLTGNHADAEDAVQDALLKAHRALGSYDPARPFKGWWFAVVRNACLDLVRQRKARRTSSLEGLDLPAPSSPDLWRAEELREALGKLTPAHREVLELRYFGECSYRGISDALGIPEGTVMSRLFAARNALAAISAKEDR